MELEDGASVASGAFGKNNKGNACFGYSHHPDGGADSRAAATTTNIDRTRHGGHPPEERPVEYLGFCNEDTGMKCGQDDDVQVAEVVRDDDTIAWREASAANGDTHSFECVCAKLMQPCSSLLGRAWTFE
jgi:hypothetical protein